MLDRITQKVMDRSSYFFFVIGVILILLSAAGGITIGNFTMPLIEPIVRIFLVILGVLILCFGIFVFLREEKRSTEKGPSNGVVDVVSLTNSLSNPALNAMTTQPPVSSEDSAFKKWDIEKFRSRLATANQEICLLSVSNNMLFTQLNEEFRDFIRRGGKIRCILIKPDSSAMRMVAARGVDKEKDMNYLKQQYIYSVDRLREIVKSFPERKGNECIKLKCANYLNSLVLTIIDPDLHEGIAFVTIVGFEKYFTKRPSIILKKQNEPEWFEFFTESFENLWNSSVCESVNLNQ